MKLESAKLLESAANHAGIELSIIEDYSGRGMYGRTTAAVELNSSQDIFGILAVFIDPDFNQEEESDNAEVDRYEMIDEIASLKSDNLGHNIIFY
jgi:hypothetical protein